jgi:signal peptidase I
MQDKINVSAIGNPPAPARPGWLQTFVIGRRPKATLIRILVVIFACFVTFNFVLLPIRVTGISMEPTYRDHQIDCVNKLAYLRHEPRRGDVVAIRLSDLGIFGRPADMLMKRIIGLPGESVSFHAGRVYINGRLLDEPYLKTFCDWEHPPVQCGPDQYYVVGDNRDMSFENHVKGLFRRNDIVGKVLL